MFRTKGSTTPLVRASRTTPLLRASRTAPLVRASRWSRNDIATEGDYYNGALFYNEVRYMSGRLEDVPLSQDERLWIRLPVSVFGALASTFMFLVYNPMSWLFRPFRPIFTTPHGLVGLLIFFLLVIIPIFVTSGCLASITKPYPHNHSK
ncbi:hypothetical protein NXS19_003019 [Fusarium pseudograminearum]|nr:hypothetical protein NXS19_003019 [Fusarium pseudograminearum]